MVNNTYIRYDNDVVNVRKKVLVRDKKNVITGDAVYAPEEENKNIDNKQKILNILKEQNYGLGFHTSLENRVLNFDFLIELIHKFLYLHLLENIEFFVFYL